MLHDVWSTEQTIADKLQSRKFILINEGDAFDISMPKHESFIPELKSNQEETDTRIVLYCKYAAEQGYEQIIVKSPDSDIFWILLAHSSSIVSEILFDTGFGTRND